MSEEEKYNELMAYNIKQHKAQSIILVINENSKLVKADWLLRKIN